MDNKRAFAIQTLIVAFLLNALLLVVIYVVAGEAMEGQALTVFGLGLLFTLFLWFGVQQIGKRFIGRTEQPVAAPAPAPKAPPAPKQIAEPREAPAVQILSILQRKGRLIDFLQEDLQSYSDAQIGAAVRQIHENTKKALDEHVELAPIFEQAEGSPVTVDPGFDAEKIRLTGNIVGDPPFKGALRHRGWRVVRVDLPQRTQAPGEEMVLAAAEVEVQG